MRIWTVFVVAIIAPIVNAEETQKFIKVPVDVSVSEGSLVKIICQVENRKGKLQFAKDGLMLGYDGNVPGFDGRYQFLYDDLNKQHMLKIYNVSKSDAGWFECQVTPLGLHKGIRAGSFLEVTDNEPTVYSTMQTPLYHPPGAWQSVIRAAYNKLQFEENISRTKEDFLTTKSNRNWFKVEDTKNKELVTSAKYDNTATQYGNPDKNSDTTNAEYDFKTTTTRGAKIDLTSTALDTIISDDKDPKQNASIDEYFWIGSTEASLNEIQFGENFKRTNEDFLTTKSNTNWFKVEDTKNEEMVTSAKYDNTITKYGKSNKNSDTTYAEYDFITTTTRGAKIDLTSTTLDTVISDDIGAKLNISTDEYYWIGSTKASIHWKDLLDQFNGTDLALNCSTKRTGIVREDGIWMSTPATVIVLLIFLIVLPVYQIILNIMIKNIFRKRSPLEQFELPNTV